MHWVNFSIYILTFILCLSLSITMLTWCYYIDEKKTSFAFWFFLNIVGIKASLAFLAVSNIAAVWFDSADPPIWTLPARIMFLLMLMAQFYLVRNVQPSHVPKFDKKG